MPISFSALVASGTFTADGLVMNGEVIATRTWVDSNGNFIPDCDLLNPLANGECGAVSSAIRPNITLTMFRGAEVTRRLSDFDGDGKSDITVFRASTGTWYILNSSTNYTTSMSFSWGLSTDVPVPADYDGDGKTDPAVYRPSTGQWFILKSSTNYTTNIVNSWGLSTDTPINLQTTAGVTITFEGLAIDAAAVTTYTESGFTVLPTSGDWVARTTYGNPAPFIQFFAPAGNIIIGEVQVTAGGSAFTFKSVDLYSSTSPIPYTITGLRNSTQVFALTGTLPNTFGNFKRVLSSCKRS